MSLENYVSEALAKTKANFSSDESKWGEYLKKYGLKNYFSEDLPEEERTKRENALERIIGESAEKYSGELGGILRKVGSKGTMAVAFLNDIYAYTSNVPFSNITGLGYALFAIKSAVELPALYRYIKRSHDWYGALQHIALKPARYLFPVFGAALESGAFERMIRKRVLVEAKSKFIKEFGDYVPVEGKIAGKLKTPLTEAISAEELAEAA